MDNPGERALAELARMVETHGWAIRHVLGSSSVAPFSYTVGLTARGWDELVITGLPADVADAFIRNAVDEQASSGAFPAGGRTTALTESGSVAILRVEDRSGLTAAARILGDFEALQLVWPDSTNRLPWELGYRNPPGAQPLLAPGLN
ncbi:hypothetical protein ABIC47_003694 [Leifsonia sp. 563]|uniref:DUF4262 domain-containing protein n=1 Tax=Leifsonia sp. 563 TaxID=3156412 RepID=UPI0033982FC4